jgi:hypothetical protein
MFKSIGKFNTTLDQMMMTDGRKWHSCDPGYEERTFMQRESEAEDMSRMKKRIKVKLI